MTLGGGKSRCYGQPMAYDPMDLTGVWFSTYEYESTGRGLLKSTHRVVAVHEGARLLVHSVSGAKSQLSMDLTVDELEVTGTWAEQTERGGHYAGARYHGAVQMILNPSERTMQGRWVGFSRDLSTVNTGTWSLGPGEGPPGLD